MLSLTASAASQAIPVSCCNANSVRTGFTSVVLDSLLRCSRISYGIQRAKYLLGYIFIIPIFTEH